jgi:hypothetical protein
LASLYDSSTRLELEHCPHPLTRLIWALLLLIFLTFSVFTADKVTLTCSRSQPEQGSCQITRVVLLPPNLVTTTEFPIATLKKAEEEGSKGCRRIYLYLENKSLIASSCRGRTNQDEWRNIPAFKYRVSQINNFLAVKTRRSLRVESANFPWAVFWIFSLPSICFLVWMLANSQVKVTHIDKSSRQLTLSSYGLLSRTTETHDLTQVAWIEVEEDRFGGYWLELVLRSHRRVRLTNFRFFLEGNSLVRRNGTWVENFGGRRQLQKIGERMNQLIESDR